MENLSLKAQVLVKILEVLEARSNESKVNVYQIMNKLDELDIEKMFPDADEEDVLNIKYEMTQKSIGTTMTSLQKRNIIVKTEATAFTVDNKMKNLVGYYLV